MATYTEAPTFDVMATLNDTVTSTTRNTDNLLLSVVDSCGLLGTAQGLVDEAAADAASAADAALNKIVETAGNITKKLKDFTSSVAGSIGAYLSETFSSINAYIRELFNNADTDPETGGKESSQLDDFVNAAQSLVNIITNAFNSAASLVASGFNTINVFLNGVDGEPGFINDVLGVTNDLRTMASNGTTQALAAVGGGVSAAFDSLAGPLSDGKSPEDIIKEKHSAAIKNKAEAVTSQSAGIISELDTGILSALDQLTELLP